MNIGKNIKAMRQEYNKSAKDIAVECGVQPQTVYAWEAGRIKISLKHLVEIADLFEVPLDELVK